MKRLLVIIILAFVVLTAGCIGTSVVGSNPAATYIPQQISAMKVISGEARVSAYPVNFTESEALALSGIEEAAGVGAGSVMVCMQASDYCDEAYLFSSEAFEITPASITALANETGRIRVYADNGAFYIGFKPEEQ